MRQYLGLLMDLDFWSHLLTLYLGLAVELFKTVVQGQVVAHMMPVEIPRPR
jgi:hypothetical protein